MFIARWRLVCLQLSVLNKSSGNVKENGSIYLSFRPCYHTTDNIQSTPDADRLGHGRPFRLPTGYATTLANGVLFDVAPPEVEELHHIQQDETLSHWGLDKNGHRFANDVIKAFSGKKKGILNQVLPKSVSIGSVDKSQLLFTYGLVNKRQWANTGTNDRRLNMASVN